MRTAFWPMACPANRGHWRSPPAPPRARLLHRVRPALLVVLLTVLSGLAATPEATPRETQDLLRRALNAGAYDQAIPLLQQLIEWFKNSTKPSLQRDLERFRFQLGLCHYLTGQFAESGQAFSDYLEAYRNGPHAPDAAVYLGDGYRFTQKLEQALRQYQSARKTYAYDDDWSTDILCSMTRCRLAQGHWGEALPLLQEVYRVAPDDQRATWAATLICTAYLKESKLADVWRLVPYLLQTDSPAARSVAFNVAALEAGDALFAAERYREALWVYRLVHPRGVIEERTKRLLRDLKDDVEDLRDTAGAYRELLRAQEAVSEAETELAALAHVPDYDVELRSRIARAYLEVRRFREARTLFLELRADLPPAGSEEALYLAFHCSTQLTPWERALELGLEYMKAYPGGTFYDAVSLAVGQMYAATKDYPRTISSLTTALQVHPQHEHAAECLFLIGYASFMEEQYASAVRTLKDLNTRFPTHDRIEESTYWLGMALLFSRNYEEASRLFDQYLEDYPKSPYAEDAAFRRGVCAYGMSRFADATQHFDAFAARYPASALLGEMRLLQADMAGAEGDLQKAVARYRQALGETLNIELYNYCSFRTGEMLADLQDFPAIVAHFRQYIERNREGSNLPLAVYWVARGLWQQGQTQDAMTYLLEAVDKYGRDPQAAGVDLVLEEWVSRSKNLPPALAKEAWIQFGNRLVAAREEHCLPLQLRLEHIFLYNPGLTDKARELIQGSLLREEAIPEAPPGILQYLMREAQALGKPELAELAAERLLTAFADTDSVLGARMLLAQRALERADLSTAEEHLRTVRETFATAPEAAQALLQLGGLYLQQGRYSDADRCFQDVLGVREWRGPLWPEALYGRGECARAQRQFAVATAFYERIYVLYSSYRTWCAKAYLQRARCLQQLHEDDKARETLAEMLSEEDLAALPEGAEARELIGRLAGRATP